MAWVGFQLLRRCDILDAQWHTRPHCLAPLQGGQAGSTGEIDHASDSMIAAISYELSGLGLFCWLQLYLVFAHMAAMA